MINPEEHARLLRERREREAKMERENAERAQRYKQLETDLGIKIKPWCCPCKLRYPERHTGADHRDIRCVVSPVFDHARSWWRGSELFAVVGEPYDADGGDVAELHQWCAQHGLKVEVTAQHAVHFPPYTLAVIVARAEDRIPDRRLGG